MSMQPDITVFKDS